MSKFKVACIIDDDPIYILTTKKIMEQVGFCEEIIVFNNGRQAIEGLSELSAAGRQMPDVILLDINMPVMDGWQFAEEYKQLSLPCNADIYVVSSSIDPEDIKRAHLTPCVKSYLTKPLTRSILEGVVNEQRGGDAGMQSES